MFNFSRLGSGKIPTAYIHGILAFPRFCTITRSTRLVPFFAVLTNYPRTSAVESENSGMAGKLNLPCRTTDEMEFNY